MPKKTIQIDFKKSCQCLIIARQTYEFVMAQFINDAQTDPQRAAKAPTLFNFALACELFLKVIYASENNYKIPATHDLESIFNTLADTTKSEVKKSFESNPQRKKLLLSTTKFEGLLSQTKDIFEKYRYAFENIDEIKKDNKHGDYIFFLCIFAQALNRYIQDNITHGL